MAGKYGPRRPPADTAPPPDASANPLLELDRLMGGGKGAELSVVRDPPVPAAPAAEQQEAVGVVDEERPLVTKAITFDLTINQVYALASRAAALPDPGDGDEQYETVRVFLGQLRTTRGDIERRRKDLKEDALRYGQRVDAAARVLREAIEAFEIPIEDRKKAVDKERERAKWAADNEARLAEEERQRQANAAAQAAEAERLRAQQEAQAAEDKRLRGERAKLDAEAVRVRKETEALEQQQRQQREKEEAEQRERQRREAAEQAERDRVAKEEADRAEAARRAPDAEKLKAFARQIVALANNGPELTTAEAGEAFDAATGIMLDAAEKLQAFGKRRST